MIQGIFWVLQETFFESLPARAGPPSAILENSRNLASSSRGLRHDITGNTVNSNLQSPKQNSGGRSARKAYVDRKVGECYHWKANGQCSKGDSCSFRHDPASGNRCEAQRAKGQSSSLAANLKAQTDGDTVKKLRQQRRKPFR